MCNIYCETENGADVKQMCCECIERFYECSNYECKHHFGLGDVCKKERRK